MGTIIAFCGGLVLGALCGVMLTAILVANNDGED